MAQEVKIILNGKTAAAVAAGAADGNSKGLLTEREWRSVGVMQSLGWQHYMQHVPEPHVLCFRRPLNVMFD